MQSLEDLIQPYIDRCAILGAAVAIFQKGEITYMGGFGTTSVEEGGVPITPRTFFAYGSIAKTICATLIMRLVAKGLLDLDTPIAHYLPDLQFSREDYGRNIALRHLLSHTSGLPMAGKYWGPRDPDSLRRFVYEQIPFYTFLTEPGTVHLYSNTVFCIAGHVAEAVVGKYYDDLVQEYVFDPLQMTQTTFDPAVALTYPLALPHKKDADGHLRVIHKMPYNVSGNPSSFALGPLSDFANLAQMYLNQGQFDGKQFLPASSIAEMHQTYGSRYMTGADHPLAHVYEGYGLGFEVGQYKGRRVARHGGQNLSNECFFDLFPEQQAGLVLLTNYSREEPLIELWAALYDRALNLPPQGVVFLEKPKLLSLAATQLQAYVGTYLCVETADLATCTLVNNELILRRQENSVPLVAFEADKFYAVYGNNRRMPVEFVRDSTGEIVLMMVWGQPYNLIDFDPEFEPDLALWQSYVGMYKDPSNSARDEILTVRLPDNVLYIAEGEYESAATSISNRCFLSDAGLVEFLDSSVAGVKTLVVGKATCYYPLIEDDYHAHGVIKYQVDIPYIPSTQHD